MNERSTDLEAEVVTLRSAVEALGDRVGQLEKLISDAGAAARGRPSREPPATVVPETEEEGLPSFGSMTARAGANLGAGWIGAMLLALAGGFLLRALAESEVLSRALGTVVGLGYAFLWAVASFFLAARNRRRPATAAGLVSALIVVPLLWESCVHYRSLPPPAAAGLLLGFGILLLVTSERFRLHLVTAITVLATGFGALAMAVGTATFEPFVAVLAILAIAAAFRGPRRGGVSPWFAFALANLGLLLMLSEAVGGRIPVRPGPAVGILAVFALGSLAGFIRWSRSSGRTGAQATLQGSFALLVGLGGALATAKASLPGFGMFLASFAVVMGGGGYVFLLFTFRWSRANRWPFLLYSSLALAAVALGAMFLLEEPAWFFGPLALVLGVVGLRLGRVSPSLHAAVAALLAAIVGGVPSGIFHALAAPAGGTIASVGATTLASLVVVCVCAVLPLKAESPIWPRSLPRAGRAAVVLMALLGLDALVVSLTAEGVAGSDPGSLAALRTGVLSISVVLLAAGSRWAPLGPARALVWPLLAAIALKLLAEDIPQGRAMTLAVALLLGGGSLILSSHLLRTSRAGS